MLSTIISFVYKLVSILGVLTFVCYLWNRLCYSPKIYFEAESCHQRDDFVYEFQVMYGTRSKRSIEVLESMIVVPIPEVLVIASEQDQQIIANSPLLDIKITKQRIGWQRNRGIIQYLDRLGKIGIGLRFIPRTDIRAVDIEVILRARVREDQLPLGADMFPSRVKTIVKKCHFEVEPLPFDLDSIIRQPMGKGGYVYPSAIPEEEWPKILQSAQRGLE